MARPSSSRAQVKRIPTLGPQVRSNSGAGRRRVIALTTSRSRRSPRSANRIQPRPIALGASFAAPQLPSTRDEPGRPATCSAPTAWWQVSRSSCATRAATSRDLAAPLGRRGSGAEAARSWPQWRRCRTQAHAPEAAPGRYCDTPGAPLLCAIGSRRLSVGSVGGGCRNSGALASGGPEVVVPGGVVALERLPLRLRGPGAARTGCGPGGLRPSRRSGVPSLAWRAWRA